MRFVPSLWDRCLLRRDVLWNVFEHAENVLFSYNYIRSVPPDQVREKLKIPDNVKIWIDSSGFQIGKKLYPQISIFELYDYQHHSADVAFTLDIPGDYEQTYKNAIRMLAYARGKGYGPKIYAVVTCDGNIDIAEKLARKYEEWDFDGIAIGPPISLGAIDFKLITRLIARIKKAASKPIHVFGVGSYDLIYLLAALDVDSFDSAKFIHGAKWREYHFPRGSIIYLGNNYKERRRGFWEGELPCTCPVCQKLRRAEEFQKSRAESVAYLALHNFYVMRNEVKLIEMAKRGGWFHRLLKEQAGKSIRLRQVLEDIKLF